MVMALVTKCEMSMSTIKGHSCNLRPEYPIILVFLVLATTVHSSVHIISEKFNFTALDLKSTLIDAIDFKGALVKG